MKKPKILLIKIKLPNKPLKIIEAKKKNGWKPNEIKQFIEGTKQAYPTAEIFTSTIMKG